MSSRLTWKPVHEGEQTLSHEFKYMLEREFNLPIKRVFNKEDLYFLRGMQCAGVKEAALLISAISRYGEILVEEIFQ